MGSSSPYQKIKAPLNSHFLIPDACKADDSACLASGDFLVSVFEDINDEIEDSAGILLVMNREKWFATKSCKIQKFPALALYKNGADHCVQYPGTFDIEDATDVGVSVLNWLSAVETMDIEGQIELVNGKMLENIIETEDDVLVFFHGLGKLLFSFRRRHLKDIGQYEVVIKA